MAGEVREKKAFGFSLELRRFLETGKLSESFFRKLYVLAEGRVRKQSSKPDHFGLPGHDWDEETIHGLAVDFFTDHLASKEERRLNYLLDLVRGDHDVDFLIIKMLDQYMAELVRRRFPHRLNLRNRVRKTMEVLAGEKKVEPVPGRPGLWAPVGMASSLPIRSEDLERCAPDLPTLGRRRYDGEQRVSPEISSRDLQAILSSVLESIEGPVHEDDLVEFVSHLLGIKDAGFESMEAHGEEGDQAEDWISFRGGRVGSQEHDPEMALRIRRGIDRLTPRQKAILKMQNSGDLKIEEMAERLGVKKTVVYDELKRVNEILRGELGE